MSQVRIYLYRNCTSCRNAESVFRNAGVAYQERDIFKDRLNVEELRSLFREIGKRPLDLLSRRSNPFRELELANRSLNDDEIIELMAEHPALLKRPIIVSPGSVQIGFNRGALEMLAQQHKQG